ncbi:hypothetical protein SAMD00019534_028530, partial [Acytostelium subglobosum LB1]|uniref:hypothetical protein n=1 Tax=Acytostelium subglobosum LB1 TaxID=1410327 RepID=UPI00064512BE
WPSSINTLKINSKKPMTQGYLPSSLTKLVIGEYDHELQPGSLPPSITELKAKNFRHKLKPGVLPPSLTTLTLGSPPYMIRPHILPSSLITLTIKSIDGFRNSSPFALGSLPDSLQTLILSDEFNQNLVSKDILPVSLTALHFGDQYYYPLPPGVLPSTLLILKFSKESEFYHSLDPGSLPNSLHTLRLGSGFNDPLVPGSLPDSITKLTFGANFNQTIHGRLPLFLTTLKFGISFDKPFTKGSLPRMLRSLQLGFDYKSNIFTPGLLPSSLDTLVLRRAPFKRLTTTQIPLSLTRLDFGGPKFNMRFRKAILPETLKWLRLGRDFNHEINLPRGLTHLTLNSMIQFNRCRTMSIEGHQLEELNIEETQFPGMFKGPKSKDPIWINNLRLVTHFPESTVINDIDWHGSSISKFTNILLQRTTIAYGIQSYFKLRKIDDQHCICVLVKGNKITQYHTI